MAGKNRSGHPVHRAAMMMDSTIERLREHKNMVHPEPTRAEERRARVDAAAPDIQAMKRHLTLEQLDKLARLDQEK